MRAIIITSKHGAIFNTWLPYKTASTSTNYSCLEISFTSVDWTCITWWWMRQFSIKYLKKKCWFGYHRHFTLRCVFLNILLYICSMSHGFRRAGWHGWLNYAVHYQNHRWSYCSCNVTGNVVDIVPDHHYYVLRLAFENTYCHYAMTLLIIPWMIYSKLVTSFCNFQYSFFDFVLCVHCFISICVWFCNYMYVSVNRYRNISVYFLLSRWFFQTLYIAWTSLAYLIL